MPEAKVSKAQQKAVNKYVRERYDRINVTFPKGTKERIQEAAASSGCQSVNEYIQRAVYDKMSMESSQEAEA